MPALVCSTNLCQAKPSLLLSSLQRQISCTALTLAGSASRKQQHITHHGLVLLQPRHRRRVLRLDCLLVPQLLLDAALCRVVPRPALRLQPRDALLRRGWRGRGKGGAMRGAGGSSMSRACGLTRPAPAAGGCIRDGMI